MDPRVKATTAELTKQFELSQKLCALRAELQPIGKKYSALVRELAKAKERVGQNPMKEQIEALQTKFEALANPVALRFGAPPELDALDKVKQLFDAIQSVDAAPTPAQENAVTELQRATIVATKRWREIPPEVVRLNAQLAAANLEPLKIP
jgi:hypothetical protein